MTILEEIRERVEKATAADVIAWLRKTEAGFRDMGTIAHPTAAGHRKAAEVYAQRAEAIDALLARLASAESALRPFADAGQDIHGIYTSDAIMTASWRIADLRKAAAHFSEDKTDE